MTNKIFNLRWVLPVALIALLAACQPGSPDYVSDYDIVYTNYKKDFDFKTVNTYFLPDSVAHVTDGTTAGNHKYDAQILSSLQANLNALGWTKADPLGGAAADVVVLPTASDASYASCASYCYYCYYGWYPGWGYYPPMYPGYGYGYPAGTVCNTYSTGTLAVAITLPKLAVNDTLPVGWIGVLNGLLEGGDAAVNDRIGKNINQMFLQSPYLKK